MDGEFVVGPGPSFVDWKIPDTTRGGVVKIALLSARCARWRGGSRFGLPPVDAPTTGTRAPH